MAEASPSLNDLYRAVQVEAKAAHSAEAATYTLEQGHRLAYRAGRFYYSFRPQREPRAPDDAPATLTVRGRVIPCTFSRTSNLGELQVVVAEDCEDKVPVAYLKLDTDMLFSRLKETLAEILQSPDTSRFNLPLAQAAISGRQPEHLARHEEVKLPLSLNPDQREAVSVALRHPVAFIWTPPGTGRAKVFATIVADKVTHGKTVLVTSRSACSLDAIMGEVHEVLAVTAPDLVESSRVLRRGPMPGGTPERGSNSTIELASVLVAREEDTLRELSRLSCERHSLELGIKELETRARETEAVAGKQRAIEASSRVLTRARSQMDGIETRLRDLTCHGSQLEAKLKRARESRSVWSRLFGARPRELENELRSLRGLLAFTHREQMEQAHRLKELSARHAALDLPSTDVKRPVEHVTQSSSVGELISKKSEVLTSIDELSRRLSKLQQALLSQARVVGATSTLSFVDRMEDQFDTVIIDEASGIPLPVVHYLCGLARESVVLASDFRQQGLVSYSSDPLAAEVYAADVFATAGIIDAVEGETLPAHLAVLTHIDDRASEMVALTNERWYGGDLDCTVNPERDEHLPPALTWLNESSLVIVDTSSLSPLVHEYRGAQRNPIHAALARFVWALVSTDGTVPSSRGIVSLSAEQSSLIRHALEQAEFSINSVTTPSVFGHCGVDILVLDTVDSPPGVLGHLLGATSVRSEVGRLLDSALCTASRKLIMIANLRYLDSTLTTGHLFFTALHEARSLGKVIDARELLTNFRVTALNSPGVVACALGLITPQIFAPPEALSGLIDDLAYAKKSIDISVPFALIGPADPLLRSLQERVDAGVRVRVIARPPRECGELRRAEVTKNLRALTELGCEVWTRTGLLERVVAIDGEVLWNGTLPGSLDEIARGDRTITRLVGAELCDHVRQLWSDEEAKRFFTVSEARAANTQRLG